MCSDRQNCDRESIQTGAEPHGCLSRAKSSVTSIFVPQVSEKETVSRSAGSPATDVAVSSSRNGPVTSGTSKSESPFPGPCEESRACMAASARPPLLTRPRTINVCFRSCCYATISTFVIFDLGRCFLAPHLCNIPGHFCRGVNIRECK